MNKNTFMRYYLSFGTVFVALMMFLQYQFLHRFPMTDVGIYGSIDAGIFNYHFENYLEMNDVANTPLYIFIVFFVLTLLVAVYALRGEALKHKLISDIVVYNVILSVMFIASSIVFMVLIPDRINGMITHKFFTTTFAFQSDVVVTAYNFVYTFMVIYIGLNVFALISTKEKKFKEKKEVQELDSEFL